MEIHTDSRLEGTRLEGMGRGQGQGPELGQVEQTGARECTRGVSMMCMGAVCQQIRDRSEVFSNLICYCHNFLHTC